MDRKDLSQIRPGGPGFTAKWWKEKGPEATRGCGVERALEDWDAACPRSPESFADDRAAEAARKAAAALIAAATKARAKCGREDKEAQEACALYVKLATGYRDRIAVAEADEAPQERNWPKVAADLEKSLAEAKTAAATAGRLMGPVATANKAVAQVTVLANARLQGKAGKPVGTLLGQLDRIESGLTPVVRFLGAQARPQEAHRKHVIAAQRIRSHAAEVDRIAAELDGLAGTVQDLEQRLDDTLRELGEARRILMASERTLDSVRAAFADFRDKIYDHMQVSLQDMPAELGEVVTRAIAVLRRKDQEMTSADRDALLDEAAAIGDRMGELQRIAKAHAKAAASMRSTVSGFEKEPDIAAALPKLDKDIAAMAAALKTAAKAVAGVEKVAQKIASA